jgi:hypothetical protein
MEETRGLPDFVLEEVLDYVKFLKARIALERFDTALASEASLGRDWLRPEEDEAWKDL